MRGKTALPFTRSGAELSTTGVPAGMGLDGGVPGAVGATPGGAVGGGRTNGEVAPPADDVASAAVVDALAAADPGQGSVLNDPRASSIVPPGDRVATRNRYVVAGSRPPIVVRVVCAERANVVGDQIP